MRLAILASGNGTNAEAIVQAAIEGRLHAEVAVILTNRPGAGVIARAQRLGVPLEVVPSKGAASREEYDQRVVDVLAGYRVDTIALAGWMRILSEVFLSAYEGRIVNLHPAILPSFTGGTGIADAYEYGVKITGCTVHLVSPVLDGGPIIIQAAVPVSGTQDELEARIHQMEHLIFVQALEWLSEDRLRLDGRRVVLLPEGSESGAPKTHELFSVSVNSVAVVQATCEVSRTPSREGVDIVDGCLISPPLER